MPINYVSTDLNVATVPFAWAARHMQVQMLRNISTANWIFQTKERQSLPGCIIASPSLPDGAISDQDYNHFWVRDGAVTIVEAVDNPLFGNGVLDDYVEFSRTCQLSVGLVRFRGQRTKGGYRGKNGNREADATTQGELH